eukprot:gnl/Carplike_NY0171/2452_a3297_524.p1 GENE.gnl/Carplike_NY0171/2452_a3297_524~~gnl/Carplike_NY0171/2452_a3297_524.p1  ORF type:complete len:470 (+),score=91.02 gnl/Carplike_NY0171/2452_a3297_524:59-1411(+)
MDADNAHRLVVFQNELFGDCESELEGSINLYTLSEHSFHGIPDEKGIRILCWSLLLGYLPEDRSQWFPFLTSRRKLYHSYVHEVFHSFFEERKRNDEHRTVVKISGDDTSSDVCSRISAQIEKDLRRTKLALNLFVDRKPSDIKHISEKHRKAYMADFEDSSEYSDKTASKESVPSTKTDKTVPNPDDLSDGETPTLELEGDVLEAVKPPTVTHDETSSPDIACDPIDSTIPPPDSPSAFSSLSLPELSHLFGGIFPSSFPSTAHDVLFRVLFTFARLNRSVEYVQGMNEISAVMLYVLITSSPLAFSQVLGRKDVEKVLLSPVPSSPFHRETSTSKTSESKPHPLSHVSEAHSPTTSSSSSSSITSSSSSSSSELSSFVLPCLTTPSSVHVSHPSPSICMHLIHEHSSVHHWHVHSHRVHVNTVRTIHATLGEVILGFSIFLRIIMMFL